MILISATLTFSTMYECVLNKYVFAATAVGEDKYFLTALIALVDPRIFEFIFNCYVNFVERIIKNVRK